MIIPRQCSKQPHREEVEGSQESSWEQHLAWPEMGPSLWRGQSWRAPAPTHGGVQLTWSRCPTCGHPDCTESLATGKCWL